MKIFHLKEHFKQFKTASKLFTWVIRWLVRFIEPRAQRPNGLLSGQKTERDAFAVEIDIEDADVDFLVEFDLLATHLGDVD